MATDVRQTHFRFGIDELAESTHGWYAAEDVNLPKEIIANWTFLLRFCEQEVGGTAAANTDAVFQYNKNGAGWIDITTTSSVIKAVAAVALTDGGNCTKRLSGTGTFESSGAGQTEDGSSGGSANDIAASGNSETECGLQVVYADVANGDQIQLRFRSPDWTITYTVTPTLTVLFPIKIIPMPISGIGGILEPTVILGSLSLTPTPASAVQGGVDPTVDISSGGVTVTPDPIFALGNKVDPIVILGSLILTPDGLNSVASKVDPVVILGSVLIIPSTIDTLGGTVNPTIILGSISLTPDTIWVIASGQDPTVDIGGAAILPEAIFAIGAINNPAVKLGSMIAIPSPIAVLSDRVNPDVILGSLVITCEGADPGSSTWQFTYQLAGKIHRKYKPL